MGAREPVPLTIRADPHAMNALRQRCACMHARFAHGLWNGARCDPGCKCPGFRAGARIRLHGILSVDDLMEEL